MCFPFQPKAGMGYRDEMGRISELEGTLEGSSFNLQMDDQRKIPLTASLRGTSPILLLKPLSGCPSRGKQLSAGGSHASGPHLNLPLPICWESQLPPRANHAVLDNRSPQCPPVSTKHALVLQSFATHHGFQTEQDAPFPSRLTLKLQLTKTV